MPNVKSKSCSPEVFFQKLQKITSQLRESSFSIFWPLETVGSETLDNQLKKNGANLAFSKSFRQFYYFCFDEGRKSGFSESRLVSDDFDMSVILMTDDNLHLHSESEVDPEKTRTKKCSRVGTR